MLSATLEALELGELRGVTSVGEKYKSITDRLVSTVGGFAVSAVPADVAVVVWYPSSAGSLCFRLLESEISNPTNLLASLGNCFRVRGS